MNTLSSNSILSLKIDAADFDSVRKIKGSNSISSDFPAYLVDESKLEGSAELLFFPKTEAEIVAILHYLKKSIIPAFISAARTGIVGSSVPSGGAVISVEKMDRMTGFGYDQDKERYFCRFEPGISLQTINDKLLKKELEKVDELTPEAVSRFKEDKNTYHYVIDPTELSASLGGTVATNASGARTFKYGATRKWIKKIKVVLDNAEVLDIPRGKYFASDDRSFIIEHSDGSKRTFKIPSYEFNTKVKNAAGIFSKPNMDLIDLFIGSEGIFGIITEIEVWITKKHEVISNVLFFNSEEDALTFVDLIQNETIDRPEYIEFFSKEGLDLLRKVQNSNPSFINTPKIPVSSRSAIFFDIPYSEEEITAKFEKIEKLVEKCNTDLHSSWSAYENREFARFKHFRHALPETVNSLIADRKKQYPEIHKLGTDMSVPREHIKGMMKFYHSVLNEADLEYVIWGHIGDFHVHVNILPKNPEELELGLEIYEKFARKAVEYGGSISAEHGIGRLKSEYLKIMYSEDEIEEMKKIKRVLDPQAMFNQGNIFVMDGV
jgi:D-lactate dehydrogenase (cytochrome)